MAKAQAVFTRAYLWLMLLLTRTRLMGCLSAPRAGGRWLRFSRPGAAAQHTALRVSPSQLQPLLQHIPLPEGANRRQHEKCS